MGVRYLGTRSSVAFSIPEFIKVHYQTAAMTLQRGALVDRLDSRD